MAYQIPAIIVTRVREPRRQHSLWSRLASSPHRRARPSAASLSHEGRTDPGRTGLIEPAVMHELSERRALGTASTDASLIAQRGGRWAGGTRHQGQSPDGPRRSLYIQRGRATRGQHGRSAGRGHRAWPSNVTWTSTKCRSTPRSSPTGSFWTRRSRPRDNVRRRWSNVG